MALLGLALATSTTLLRPAPLAARPSTPQRVEVASLPEAIDAILVDSRLTDAQIGISVVDLATGKSIYGRGAELALNPASNAKLVTTSAALRLLGPEHRYVTRVLRKDGGLAGGTVSGDVYLQGSGDPELVTEDLLSLAAELAARGVKKITGGIVVDASAFDRDEYPPGFEQKQEVASYRSRSGAVSVNFNSFVLRAAAGAKVGDAALIGLDPPVRSIRVVSTATTAAGRGTQLFADLEDTKAGITLELRGTIGEDAPAARYRYPIDDPSRQAGEVFAWALKANGIKVTRSKIKFGKPPSKARGLAAHFSRPLGSLIRPVNKYSNNFMAEQILKTLADPEAPATFASAVARLDAELRAAGLPMEGVKMVNGSGLYDTNRVTPKLLTALLGLMYEDFRYSADFLASLSVMGVDGTARSRLDDTAAERWVRVKTGTLDGISALSGYVGAKNRKPIVFSLLFNDLPGQSTASARSIQDEIVDAIVLHANGEPLMVAPAPVQ